MNTYSVPVPCLICYELRSSLLQVPKGMGGIYSKLDCPHFYRARKLYFNNPVAYQKSIFQRELMG